VAAIPALERMPLLPRRRLHDGQEHDIVALGAGKMRRNTAGRRWRVWHRHLSLLLCGREGLHVLCSQVAPVFDTDPNDAVPERPSRPHLSATAAPHDLTPQDAVALAGAFFEARPVEELDLAARVVPSALRRQTNMGAVHLKRKPANVAAICRLCDRSPHAREELGVQNPLWLAVDLRNPGND
jgi:hypothetical protein